MGFATSGVVMKACHWFLLPLLVLLALPTFAASRAERLASFEQFAEPAVASFRYWQLTGFETLSNDTIALWTGVNKVYLIKVLPPCPQFDFATAISVTHTQTNIVSRRFDAVLFDQQRCMIDSIRPVDYKAMRQAERAQRGAANAARSNG